MKLLVTGGAGFIGSNFVRYILKNYPEDSVVNFDKLTYAGNLENLKDVENDKRYQFVKGDICDYATLKQAATGADAIVHMAAETHVDRSIHSSREFLETNVLGTQNIIDLVRELTTVPLAPHPFDKLGAGPNPLPKGEGIKESPPAREPVPSLPREGVGGVGEEVRFVHISTDEVYGDVESPHKSKEGDALVPSSPYAASKAASDLLVLAAIRTHNLPAMITRCTNNYGPYHYPEKIIPLFITNLIENKKVPLYDGGTQIRDWLYVEDHCLAIDTVLRKGKVGEVYNIAAEQEPEVSNRELTMMILKSLGKGVESIEEVAGLRPGHDSRYALDSSKIRQELGWKPAVALEEGLARTISWYQDNQDWWQRVKTGVYQEYYKNHYGE